MFHFGAIIVAQEPSKDVSNEYIEYMHYDHHWVKANKANTLHHSYSLSIVTGSGHVKYIKSPFFTLIWSVTMFFNS